MSSRTKFAADNRSVSFASRRRRTICSLSPQRRKSFSECILDPKLNPIHWLIDVGRPTSRHRRIPTLRWLPQVGGAWRSRPLGCAVSIPHRTASSIPIPPSESSRRCRQRQQTATRRRRRIAVFFSSSSSSSSSSSLASSFKTLFFPRWESQKATACRKEKPEERSLAAHRESEEEKRALVSWVVKRREGVVGHYGLGVLCSHAPNTSVLGIPKQMPGVRYRRKRQGRYATIKSNKDLQRGVTQ